MAAPNLDLRLKWLILVVVIGGLLYLFGPALAPFVIAALFAYLFNPLVQKLERRGIGRSLGVSLVFLVLTLVLIGIVLGLIPLMDRQVTRFIDQVATLDDLGKGCGGAVDRAAFRGQPRHVRQRGTGRHARGPLEGGRGICDDRARQVSKSGFAIIAWH